MIFTSKNDHAGVPLTRRDDLISLAYVLIFLFNMELEWTISEEEENNAEQIVSRIAATKLNLSPEELC